MPSNRRRDGHLPVGSLSVLGRLHLSVGRRLQPCPGGIEGVTFLEESFQPHNSSRSTTVPDAADTAGLLEELRLLWKAATPQSISSDLARARRMVESARPELRDEAERYIEALERLEHWLHDR